MSRTGIWLANGVLVVLCCFLAARILTEVAAGVLAPTPAYAGTAPLSAAPRATWDERQVILQRNLFDASILAPAALPVEQEEETYARTKLNVRLLATVAGKPQVSWAAVEDLDTRDTHVVRVNDKLQGRAEVTRIERRRIVLRNGGRLEELVLDAEAGAGAARPRSQARARNQPRRTVRRAPPARVNDRVQQLAENRFSVARSDVESVAQNPAQLFSQARILPKYEDGQMVGVQLNAIKEGSLFKQIGIKDGDVITNLNGIAITNQQDSAKVLKELTEASEFNVDVQHTDGTTSSLSYELKD